MAEKTNVLWFVKPEDYCDGCGYAIYLPKIKPGQMYIEAISYSDGRGRYHMGCGFEQPRHGKRSSWLVNDIMRKKREKQKA